VAKGDVKPDQSDMVNLTLGSRTMLALPVAWSKNRQPDSSSNLLILMRAFASLAATVALPATQLNVLLGVSLKQLLLEAIIPNGYIQEIVG